MKYEELTNLAHKVSERLGDPSLKEDLISELYILSKEKDLSQYTVLELAKICSRALLLNVCFNELNDTCVAKVLEDDENTSFIESFSDNVTAESLIIDHQEQDSVNIEKHKAKLESIEELRDSIVDLTFDQEDIIFLKRVLGYTYKEIYDCKDVYPISVGKMLKTPITRSDFSVFDRVSIQLTPLDIQWSNL